MSRVNDLPVTDFFKAFTMNQYTAYHQIGSFVVSFQHLEAVLTELLVLMARADDEAIRILVNELEFSKRVKTTAVMFAWFVGLQREPDETAKAEFHKLMVELGKLGERRNEIVHSKYSLWTNIEGAAGLVRENSKLRAGKGVRQIEEEDLLPETFDSDLNRLLVALEALQSFRLKIIDWLYPE